MPYASNDQCAFRIETLGMVGMRMIFPVRPSSARSSEMSVTRFKYPINASDCSPVNPSREASCVLTKRDRILASISIGTIRISVFELNRLRASSIIYTMEVVPLRVSGRDSSKDTAGGAVSSASAC